MAFTMSTWADYVDGTTGVDRNDVKIVDTSGGAEVVTLPSDVKIGFKFYLVHNGINANTVTIAAAAGETLVGDTATAADNDVLLVIRSGATEWTGALIT